MRNATAGALLAILLSACSLHERYGLRPGASSAADVQRAMGAPGMELRNPDGSKQLAYTTGPAGTETFMVYLGRDGKLERIEQVLTDDRFNQLRPGTTTRDQVRAIIGPPHRTMRFDNLGQDAWEYRFQDAWGYLADFSVMIDDRGIVAGKAVRRIEGRESSGHR